MNRYRGQKGQMGLFGPEAFGAQLRDEAMAIVAEHADPEWMARAAACIGELAATGEEFTSEDVLDRVGSTREPRALGPLFMAALRSGAIVKTRFALARRPSRHRAPVQVWRGEPRRG